MSEPEEFYFPLTNAAAIELAGEPTARASLWLILKQLMEQHNVSEQEMRAKVRTHLAAQADPAVRQQSDLHSFEMTLMQPNLGMSWKVFELGVAALGYNQIELKLT